MRLNDQAMEAPLAASAMIAGLLLKLFEDIETEGLVGDAIRVCYPLPVLVIDFTKAPKSSLARVAWATMSRPVGGTVTAKVSSTHLWNFGFKSSRDSGGAERSSNPISPYPTAKSVRNSFMLLAKTINASPSEPMWAMGSRPSSCFHTQYSDPSAPAPNWARRSSAACDLNHQ